MWVMWLGVKWLLLVLVSFEEEELFNLINVKMVDPEKREFGGKLELET